MNDALVATIDDLHRLLTIKMAGQAIPVEVIRGTTRLRLTITPVEKQVGGNSIGTR